MTATLNTHSLRGPVERAVTVNSNDPAQPVVILTLKADVLVSVNVLPSEYLSLDLEPKALLDMVDALVTTSPDPARP